MYFQGGFFFCTMKGLDLIKNVQAYKRPYSFLESFFETRSFSKFNTKFPQRSWFKHYTT